MQIRRDASLAAPMLVLALAVVEAAWTPTTIGVSVTERTIEDLVVGLFLQGEGDAMDSAELRAGLRMRAVAHIAARHRNRDLSPAVVAAQLGASLRHLQRAFEDGGSTVASEISRCRAESAARLLLAPRTAGLTIADIATRSGHTSAFEVRAGFRVR
ncbi:helix-turn-helix domain-containing protein [Cryobacterium sp. GrIS_2_6]|uniref:helix-turn-helix domain-containing protein n=1 Tax=Cryobacterium sp. GrIS_2_6 TaxID=3162785 RepID=UPI002E0156BB|nr:helix-turn-helix domain-containing protein [Cryobacterium psychrotolerans]MEC5149748.1 AraC-like DNA-binding protein [Cryobacterium psychrotolerans]